MQGTDPEDVIKNAFGCFDEDNVGVIHEDKLRELLTTIGDRSGLLSLLIGLVGNI